MDKQTQGDFNDKQAQMNAVWRRISDKADEQAKADERARLRREATQSDGQKPKMSTAKKIIICVASAIALIAIAFAVWFFILRGLKEGGQPTIQDHISKLESIDETTDEGRSEISETYAASYDEYFKYLSELDPAEWTDEDADKAAFLLEYTQKLGLFSQAQDVIGLIVVAKNAGSPIDHGALSETNLNEINQWIWNESKGEDNVADEVQ